MAAQNRNKSYSPIDVNKNKALEQVKAHIENHTFALAFYRWNLDLFADLFLESDVGRRLHHDQRVFLRCLGRFYEVNAVFARSYGKTFLEVLAMMLVAILHPGIQLSISAQTLQNAAKILKDKYNDIILFFPKIKKEIVRTVFSMTNAEINFANGSVINALANSDTSKGQRRHRLNLAVYIRNYVYN